MLPFDVRIPWQQGTWLSATWTAGCSPILGRHIFSVTSYADRPFSMTSRALSSLWVALRCREIGSLSLGNNGVIGLTNRPLTLRTPNILRMKAFPRSQGESTYQCVEPYVLDLLQCHDNRIYHHSEESGWRIWIHGWIKKTIPSSLVLIRVWMSLWH